MGLLMKMALGVWIPNPHLSKMRERERTKEQREGKIWRLSGGPCRPGSAEAGIKRRKRFHGWGRIIQAALSPNPRRQDSGGSQEKNRTATRVCKVPVTTEAAWMH